MPAGDVLAGCPRNVPVPVSNFSAGTSLRTWPADSGQPGPGSKDRHAAPQRAIGRRLDIVCPARELPEPENLAGMGKAEST